MHIPAIHTKKTVPPTQIFHFLPSWTVNVKAWMKINTLTFHVIMAPQSTNRLETGNQEGKSLQVPPGPPTGHSFSGLIPGTLALAHSLLAFSLFPAPSWYRTSPGCSSNHYKSLPQATISRVSFDHLQGSNCNFAPCQHAPSLCSANSCPHNNSPQLLISLLTQ